MTDCKCGGKAVQFRPRNGGVGIKCSLCGRQYTHPDFDLVQIRRVWEYGNRHGGDNDEG